MPRPDGRWPMAGAPHSLAHVGSGPGGPGSPLAARQCEPPYQTISHPHTCVASEKQTSARRVLAGGADTHCCYAPSPCYRAIHAPVFQPSVSPASLYRDDISPCRVSDCKPYLYCHHKSLPASLALCQLSAFRIPAGHVCAASNPSAAIGLRRTSSRQEGHFKSSYKSPYCTYQPGI